MKETVSLFIFLLALPNVMKFAFALVNHATKIEKTMTRSDFRFEEGKCSFYCFWIPEKNEKINDTTLQIYMEGASRCSHVTYGFAHMDERLRIIPPTDFDFIPNDYYGNFKHIVSLRRKNENPRIQMLYGIRIMAAYQRWIDSERQHSIVARKLVWHTRIANFDGLFLHIDADLLFSPRLVDFFDQLKLFLQRDARFYDKEEPLKVVLAVKSEWALHVAGRLSLIKHILHSVYLWGDDTIISADGYASSSATSSISSSLRGVNELMAAARPIYPLAAYVDPLLASNFVNTEDTIRANAIALAEKSGIENKRIIIGLNAWTRSYIFNKEEIEAAANAQHMASQKSAELFPKTSINSAVVDKRQNKVNERLADQRSQHKINRIIGHGSEAQRLGDPGPSTKRLDGRLSYYETCKIPGFEKAHVADSFAATSSFISQNTSHWYSFNAPTTESLGYKIKWISKRGFGGIGLFSLQADDANGECVEGKRFPLHTYIAQHFRCKTGDGKTEMNADRGPRDACTRICIIDMNPTSEAPDFSFDNLKSKWCSHIVFSPLYLHPTGQLVTTEEMRQLLDDFEEWNEEDKPRLILSIGDTLSHWRVALNSAKIRPFFLENTLRAVEQASADGVDISWTRAGPETSADAMALDSFVSDLRSKLNESKEIFVSVLPSATIAQRYNFANLSRSANYIIVQGYRFHNPKNVFTGHHSPLFADREILSNPDNTIEGVMQIWAKHVDKSKLIVGVSAAPLTQTFLDKNKPIRAWESAHEIGDRADVAAWRRNTRIWNQMRYSRVERQKMNLRAASTQDEVCELLKKNITHNAFINAIGVPYLTHNNDFVAYDNKHSMQTKAIWTAINDYGGIAIHSLGADNYRGECPANYPFYLLRTIANAQICPRCNKIKTTIPFATNMPSHSKKCRDDSEMKLTCYYSVTAQQSLPPNKIPVGLCDEIVVEGAFLNGKANIVYNNFQSDGDEMQRNDTFVENFLGGVVKKWVEDGRRVFSSMMCFMPKNDFSHLMENNSSREILASSIHEHLEQFGFTGVELECDEYLNSGEIARKYNEFLRALHIELTSARSISRDTSIINCPKNIALRVPVWKTNLNYSYNINELNELVNRITIEQWPSLKYPAVVMAGRKSAEKLSAIVNPLFDITDNEHVVDGDKNFALNRTVQSWVKNGLKREIINIPIPTYGINLRRNDETSADGKVNLEPIFVFAPADEFGKITHAKVCETVSKANVSTRKTVLFDRVVGFALIGGSKEQVAFENEDTASYKVKYAHRERLGGISLMTLHNDDHVGDACGTPYPLLNAVSRAVRAC